ncbi:HsdM family class I SAM-dependent methyltransferase [Labilibaculum euxinus]
MSFSKSKSKYDLRYNGVSQLERSLCTVDGNFQNEISIVDSKGKPNEEYFKWQFIFALIDSNLVSRDFIGTEIYFPKGNIGSTPIKIDAVVFSQTDWLDYYKKYREKKDQDALNWLRKSAIFMIEFKRDGDTKKIEQIFNSQIKATIKESDCSKVLGAYYDMGRLYLFKKIGNDIYRLDNSKNFPTSQRILEQYQLEITDPYYLIPNHDQLLKVNSTLEDVDPSNKFIEDLDVIFTMNDEGIKNSLANILKSLDSVSLFNEEGYHVLIQMLAIKIYDEKQAELHGSNIEFYIHTKEHEFQSLKEESIQEFIDRTNSIFLNAKKYYKNILGENKINWKNIRHVKVASDIAYHFQRYSFMKSRKSDLYQLVFYNFATKFKKEENAQFLTPIPIINFLVAIVNPGRRETICDPCCGIGDFLSVSYVNSEGKLDDRNLYGFDNDYNMTVLAQLNMLLNGDGNACIKYMPNKGSITHKLNTENEIVELIKDKHYSGNWDSWPDETEINKYDVVLTNPPFGKGRSLDLSKPSDVAAAKYYETYDLYIAENPKAGLDLGVVFLENAVRTLKENGRFGIVLSNSIASNKSFQFARKWLMENTRVVAIVDLPQNIFAETGVNTTIIIGYKPKVAKLEKLIKEDYKVFCREIHNVGYIKKTSKRNVYFETEYALNEETFETITNEEGESITNEDFTKTINEFKEWCLFQETPLKKMFLDK